MKKFLAYFMAVTFVLLASVAYCNYKYDGTGVLNADLSGVRMTPNQEFCKMRYILSNPDRYDSFCFGSSRITTLNLKRIQDGGKWYNMTYAGGGPQQWLHDLHELLDHNVKVSTILVGIDDISYKDELFEIKQKDSYQRSYTDWDFSFYAGLLFHIPSATPDPVLVREKGSIFDLYDTGRTFCPWIDEEAEKDPAAYRSNPRFLSPLGWPDRGHYNDQLQALKELKQLADANGIKVVFFLNPVVASTYLDEDKAQLKRWRQDIANISEFYDFSGLNEINTDNFNFLDTSHYREITGDKIIDRVMNGSAEYVPGFGTLVNKDNLQEHEARLEQQEAAWLAAHPVEVAWLSVGRGLSPLPQEVRLEQGKLGLTYNLEAFDGHPYEASNTHSLKAPLGLSGWFQIDGQTPRMVLACLSEANGAKRYMLMNQDLRPDLAVNLDGSDDPLHAGFSVNIDVSTLHEGDYELSFLAQAKDGGTWRESNAKPLHMVR